MLFTLATACGKAEEGTSKDSKQNQTNDKPSKLVFMTTGDQAAANLKGNDRIISEINKRLGVELEMKIVPENSYDKINVAMATGDYPDVLTINYPSNSLSQWIDEGIIIPINDYLKDMPTVKSKLDSSLSWTAVNGKYYGYPFIEERSNWDLVYRADWLEKLGLKPPQTLDELYETLKAIATKDPDGNGKVDTFGLTSAKTGSKVPTFDFVFYAYGMPYGDWALDDKGNIIPTFEHPAFKKGMTYLKKLWDEKLIEPEYLLNDTQMKEQKFYQGKVGFMDAALFRNVNRIEASLQKVNPNGKLGFEAPPAGPDGKHAMYQAPKTGLFTAITKGAKNPEKAAKFIEFMLSKEGRDLLELGIEGVHYTKQGDKITYNIEERAKDNFASNGWAHALAWGSVVWPLTENYLPQTEPQADRAKESVRIATENMKPNLINVTKKSETEFKGVLDELYYQYFNKMLMGKIDIDTSIAELGKKWREQGGSKVLEEVTAAYKAKK
ncbi:extracellular solute-binding protein [Paenibacillus sp. LMG 31460]|uniref:Extracellular solute-binding protein n=2 Tax=Paenibacillus germinis TaxID=2654979 RepID=A0ABX1YXZ6_9BACL|nr:extracellular solute-binding protein [Paenibacillus germinis]